MFTEHPEKLIPGAYIELIRFHSEEFKEIDLSEKKGTGIPKILRELKQNGSPEPEFDMDEERTYLNAIIRIRDGFERKEKMSELERARMQIIFIYLEINKEIRHQGIPFSCFMRTERSLTLDFPL